MYSNNLFKHKYSIEELIIYFAKNSDNFYYLNTLTGEINIYNNKELPKSSFVFKSLERQQIEKNVIIDESLKKLPIEEILKSDNSCKRDLYNYIKSQVILFLSENKILPPSLNPILSFKEKEEQTKITIEIN